MATNNTAPQGAFPRLDDVITPDDVSRKGTGSYAADYVNWCRTMHLLRLHAPGWEFHLRQAPDGGHVWAAPNGSGYVVGYFRGPDGRETPDFPQAVMGNRNEAVKMASLDARDLTDTHRRCLCAAAAASFGLAWQLWAREPLEDPYQREERPRQAPKQAATQDRDKLQAAVSRRLKELGVTADGLRHIMRTQGGEDCTLLGQLPDSVLLQLAKGRIPESRVAEWNAAGKAMVQQPSAEPSEEEPLPADEELPMTWG